MIVDIYYHDKSFAAILAAKETGNKQEHLKEILNNNLYFYQILSIHLNHICYQYKHLQYLLFYLQEHTLQKLDKHLVFHQYIVL